MKQVIDYLKETDKEKLSESFVGNDLLVMVTAEMTKEEGVQFIENLCEMEKDLDESEYAVLMHPVLSVMDDCDHIYRAITIKEIEEGTVKADSFQGIPLKSLLAAKVSSKICKPAQISWMLRCVLHAAFCKIFEEELFEKFADDEPEENPEVDDYEKLTPEEQELLDSAKKAIIAVNDHFLKKAYLDFLLEDVMEKETEKNAE